MANQFLVSIDLNGNHIEDGKFEVLATAPATGVSYEGRIYYDSTLDALRVYSDGAWRTLVHSVTSTTDQLNVAGVGTNEIELSLDAASTNTADTLVLRDGSGNFSAGTITATFSGNLTGNVTGNVTGQVSDISNHTTDDLTEGSTNLYFLDSRVFDALAAATSNIDVNGQKITGLGTPTASSDAATKGYVDAARSGLDVKASVHLATDGALTATYNNGAGTLTNSGVQAALEIDGIATQAGDRILVKNQSSGAENGIYVVTTVGDGSTNWVLTRATDADTDAEVTPGMFTFVEEGNTYADTGWVLSTNATITLGTTALVFNQFSGAGTYTAGAGLSLTGGEFSVNVANGIEISGGNVQIASTAAGDGLGYSSGVLSINVLSTGGLQTTTDELGIKLNSGIAGLQIDASGLAIKSDIAGTGLTYTNGVLSVDAIDLTSASGGGVSGILPIANGGTNSSSEASARTNLAGDISPATGVSTPKLATTVWQAIGNGVDTVYTVTHNFNSRRVVVQVYDSANYDTVFADVERTDPDYVTITFATAPSSGAYTVVVVGETA